MEPPNDPPAADATASVGWGCNLCGLTSLQVNVLQLTASGYSDAEIQERYQLTSDALRQELIAAQRRLGARTKVHTVAKAFRGGWIG